jgi:hypothetical protein
MGISMKVNLSKAFEKELVPMLALLAVNMLGSSRMEKLTATVSFIAFNQEHILASSRMIYLMAKAHSLETLRGIRASSRRVNVTALAPSMMQMATRILANTKKEKCTAEDRCSLADLEISMMETFTMERLKDLVYTYLVVLEACRRGCLKMELW